MRLGTLPVHALPAHCTQWSESRSSCHVLPCCRYDRMAASLNTPGVVALLSAWAPQLQQLHQHAAVTHNASSPYRPTSRTQQQQGQQGDQYGAGERVLSLTAFLEVLQEKGAIPQLLEPCDVQEVLRQLLVTQQQQVGGPKLQQRSLWRWIGCLHAVGVLHVLTSTGVASCNRYACHHNSPCRRRLLCAGLAVTCLLNPTFAAYMRCRTCCCPA
jgi:hypothetical protein